MSCLLEFFSILECHAFFLKVLRKKSVGVFAPKGHAHKETKYE